MIRPLLKFGGVVNDVFKGPSVVVEKAFFNVETTFQQSKTGSVMYPHES